MVLLLCTCNVPGQLFVLLLHWFWLHQHNFSICWECAYCIKLLLITTELYQRPILEKMHAALD